MAASQSSRKSSGGSGKGTATVQTSMFDLFYEGFLKQFMSSGDPTLLSQDFTKLRTDLERTEFLMRIPYVRDFEIKTKVGVKCLEKATRYREEGNKMFQSDKCMEAILFYNKSISYCPHPNIEDYNKGIDHDHASYDKIKEVQFADQVQSGESRMKRTPGKYEAIALSYANRSAALRKLNQYEECLRDIARAAKFGYPRENFYKLWDRKGKCYLGLKRVDLASKCLRQSLQCLKESSLSESQKAAKAADIQAELKELRSQLEMLPETPTPPMEPQRVLTNGKTAEVAVAAQPNVSLKMASSQVSISGISASSQGSLQALPSVVVPDISYGTNTRLQSASSSVDLQFLPDKGRFFIATQDLKPGDVILKEEPYAAVLESVFRVNHCAHCLRKIPTPIPCYQCATVQYCDEGCREISWQAYHYIECGILSYLEPSRCLGRLPHLALRIVTKTGLQNLIQHSQMILPTASTGKTSVLNKQELGQFDPASYRSVHNLATNTDKRSFEDLIKKTAEAIFMGKCLKSNGFFKDTSANEGQRAEIFVSSLLLRHLQIAATNALEMAECILMNNDITKFDIIPIGGAIFPTMSFFNHSCYPNAMRLEYQNHQVIRVIRNIPKGAEINIDYGFDFYATPLSWRQSRASSQYHFTCSCMACDLQWPTYQGLVDKPPKYKKKLTPDLIELVAANATSYEVAMGHLVKLDIVKAVPLFCHYLSSMFDILVHPDARYLDCEEAYKQCLWLENRGYKVLKNAPRKISYP